MTKLYLAAKFESRESIRPVRDKLWAMGFNVVSSWLDETKKPEGMSEEEFNRKLAIKDLAEINEADILVQCTLEMSNRGGAATEFGFALGRHQRMRVYVVGPYRSVFHYLADRQFPDWDQFLAHMGASIPPLNQLATPAPWKKGVCSRIDAGEYCPFHSPPKDKPID